MKKISLFFLFAILSIVNIDAVNIDGVFGMKFGMPQEEVRQIMLKRSDFPIDKKGITKESLLYGSGKFAGRDIEALYLKFVDNKLSTVAFFFTVDLESKVVDTFREIKSELTEKYGETDMDIEDYTTPYEQGDGYTESAIKLGKASFLTRWTFDSSTNSEIKNYISLSITTSLSVMLLYQDGKLGELESQRDKEKALNDY